MSIWLLCSFYEWLLVGGCCAGYVMGSSACGPDPAGPQPRAGDEIFAQGCCNWHLHSQLHEGIMWPGLHLLLLVVGPCLKH